MQHELHWHILAQALPAQIWEFWGHQSTHLLFYLEVLLIKDTISCSRQLQVLVL